MLWLAWRHDLTGNHKSPCGLNDLSGITTETYMLEQRGLPEHVIGLAIDVVEMRSFWKSKR